MPKMPGLFPGPGCLEGARSTLRVEVERLVRHVRSHRSRPAMHELLLAHDHGDVKNPANLRRWSWSMAAINSNTLLPF